ncbi:MAG: hypothetical protein JJE51_01095 [Thermoanaerobaculia bacterium]|nr:hypothetical protein [Thermoanaerobaculia bacterium]
MSRTSRRTFAKVVAAGAVGLPLAAAETKSSPLASAMTAVVKSQSGKHLTPAELDRIGKDLEEYAPYLESLREFKLVNSDEPDFTFASLVRRW